jgi:hypothetical protein
MASRTEIDRKKKANAKQPAKPEGEKARNDEITTKEAKAAFKKPPAAAKPKAATKNAPEAASTISTASNATKQTTKQASELEIKAGPPKRKANAGRSTYTLKKQAAPPPLRRKQSRCSQ